MEGLKSKWVVRSIGGLAASSALFGLYKLYTWQTKSVINTPLQIDKKNYRIELHVHLDGSLRPSTIFELAKSKGIKLPANNVKDLAEKLIIHDYEIKDLNSFLSRFAIFTDTIVDDLDALKRISREFIEDCADNHIGYVEARFSPHLLRRDKLTVDQVIECVASSLQEAGKKHGVAVRLLLCAIRTIPSTHCSLVDLVKKHEKLGLVGIDIAGSEKLDPPAEEFPESLVKLFQEAKDKGVARTVHAGEDGPAHFVKLAVEKMHAQRIGHGYHVVEDSAIYQDVQNKNIHFECCPRSSIATGSMTLDYKKHSIRQFAKNKVNYSLSRDDPLITGYTMDQEYDLCRKKLNLTSEEIRRTNLNAAKSAFLPDDQKRQLIKHVEENFPLKL